MKAFLSIMVALVLVGSARADERGSPDEAKVIAVKAAEFLKQNGPEKAFRAFNEDAEFHDRDLYVFVQSNEGTIVANGANKAIIGKNVIDMKDVEGKAMGREVVSTKDTAWVDYKWRNPQTNAVEPKTTYIVRVGDYLVGVGAYKR
jgi:cytochrome c